MAKTKSTKPVKEGSFAEKLGHSVGTAVGAIKEKFNELVHPSTETGSEKQKALAKRKTVPAKKTAAAKKVLPKKSAPGTKSGLNKKKSPPSKSLAATNAAIPKKTRKGAPGKKTTTA